MPGADLQSAHLQSVNASAGIDAPWAARGRTGIDKRPVGGTVRVLTPGIDGDTIVNRRDHGGVDQAVYAYAREDLDAWTGILGRPLSSGGFGENLTTAGLDLQQARLGERWRIGSVLLEVAGVRIPCQTFQGFLDEPHWVRRFTDHGVPGAYLRVVEEGELTAGDTIEVVERRDHDLTVAFAFRALTTERHLLSALAAEPRISAKVRAKVERLAHPTVGTSPGGLG